MGTIASLSQFCRKDVANIDSSSSSCFQKATVNHIQYVWGTEVYSTIRNTFFFLVRRNTVHIIQKKMWVHWKDIWDEQQKQLEN